MQKSQLDTLKQISGADFVFVPANKNAYGVKYYEHKCVSDSEYQSIAGEFNQYPDMFYSCLEHSDGSCSIIVLENELDAQRVNSLSYGYVSNATALQPIGKLNGNDVYLEQIPTQAGKYSALVSHSNRAVAVVNVNGKRLPFYVSSGLSGKESEYGIASGVWYPLQGISSGGWLNKMPDMTDNPYPELDKICTMLNDIYPAPETKQATLEGQVPIANPDALLLYANHDFPEGMPANENGGYIYHKNHLVYLPEIINTWRNKPVDCLLGARGNLSIPEYTVLRNIQKKDIFCNMYLDGDVIWFAPNPPSGLRSAKQYTTDADIKRELNNNGISIGTTVCRDDRIGFGIPARDLSWQLSQQEFKRATERVNALPSQRTSGKLRSLFSKIKESIKD